MSKRIVFSDNIVQYPNRYSITDLGGGVYEIQSNPGTVTSEGTALTASTLNAISDEVIFKLKDTSTSTTTYTATLDGINSYFEGFTVLFKPANTNTSAATININAAGAKSIKKIDNNGNKVNLVANDMIKNKYSTMTYDGVDFVMNNPSADLAQVITDIQTIENKQTTDETAINTLKNQAVRFAISTGSSNAYGVSLSDVSAYYSGLVINLVPNFTNTGACTLKVNSLSATSIKFNGSDLASGTLQTNKLYTLIYDGTAFQLQPYSGQSILQNDYIRASAYADDTGLSNAYVVNLNPAPTAYTKGQTYTFLAKQNNSGASTLNVNNLGAVAIKKNVVEGSYVTDFTGKIAGSTVENPNIANEASSSTLINPSDFTVEFTQNSYNYSNSLNGITKQSSISTSGSMIQQRYKFDMVKNFEMRFGPIPAPLNKVDYVKSRLSSVQCDAWINGSSPSGNKVYIDVFATSLNSWSGTPIINTSATPTLTTKIINNVNNIIDSNGMCYFIVYTDASDGVTPSTIYTDYIKLTVTFKHGNDLVAGDISAGQMITLKHDGAVFQLQPSNNNELSIHATQPASTSTLAHVKPDGTTIMADANGTISTANDIARFKKSNSIFTTRGTSQTFTDAFCTSNSLVTVSITSSTIPQGVWKVDSANGSFTITSTVAETADITFDYYIQKAVG